MPVYGSAFMCTRMGLCHHRSRLTNSSVADAGLAGTLPRRLKSVSVESNNVVHLDLSRHHVRPEALLQWELQASPTAEAAQRGAFTLLHQTPDRSVFARESGTDTAPGVLRQIVESQFPSSQSAWDALAAAKIDVMDRVPPWLAKKWTNGRQISEPAIVVQPYRLPLLHLLVLDHRHPLLARREFRRALVYGMDRQQILARDILRGPATPGFYVLGGPFPQGIGFNDPIAYGHDGSVEVRPYQPQLAAVLQQFARDQVRISKSESPALPSEEAAAPDDAHRSLTLAHPPSDIARVTCLSIQRQLEQCGIVVKLVETAFVDEAAMHPLRYTELVMAEPVVEAWQVLGPGGIAGFCSDRMHMALREVESADNWKSVRTRLRDVYRAAHHELPVIPLWQTVAYFASRSGVEGLAAETMMLYEDVDQWRVAPVLGELQ